MPRVSGPVNIKKKINQLQIHVLRFKYATMPSVYLFKGEQLSNWDLLIKERICSMIVNSLWLNLGSKFNRNELTTIEKGGQNDMAMIASPESVSICFKFVTN